MRRRGLLAGLTAAFLGISAGAPQIVAAFGSTRTIWMHHIHTDETISITYKKDGKYDPEALKKLNWFLRDWRENQATEMDPKTIDLLWEMHTELGSKVPIDIICGYRSEKTNNMLRRTVGGQAKQSYHITGKAIDAVFPDVPLKQMRYSALVRQVGGVGYYPTSGTPFVHVDSGPVRAWPRLPRAELALLFPEGKTQHHPTDGGSISKDDARNAQARNKQLASEVAAYFDVARTPKTPAQVAAAESPPAVAPAPQPVPPRVRVASMMALPKQPAPQLTAPPQQMRAQRRPAPVTEAERGQLNALVTLAALKPADAPDRRAPAPDRAQLDRLVTASVEETPPTPPAPASADAAPAPDLGAVVEGPRRAAPLEPPQALGGPPAAPEADISTAPTPVATAAAPPPETQIVDAPKAEPPTRVAALEPPQASIAAPPAVTDAGGDNWAPAPEFDTDHPEELSYRPFPVAPLLTESDSADDSALVKVVHPDVARTLDLLDDGEVILPLRLRPGEQKAEVKSAQQFRGGAVDVSVIEEGEASRPAPAALASHPVRTTER